jgi:hypothetical protein
MGRRIWYILDAHISFPSTQVIKSSNALELHLQGPMHYQGRTEHTSGVTTRSRGTAMCSSVSPPASESVQPAAQ